MEITWESRNTSVKRVASVKHPPFPLILGVDWIVDSKTDLIVREETIVPVAQQIEEASVGNSVEKSEKEPANISTQPQELFPPLLFPIRKGEEKKLSFGLVRVREFFPDTFEPIHLATTKIFSQILSSNVRKKKKTSVCLMISFSHFRKKGKYGT
jgi:hypothetical protein